MFSGSKLSAPAAIETARLRLRAHTTDDYEECAAMWSDPEVVRFIGGTPSSAQRSWSRLLSYAGHWKLLGFGYWAIEEKASGRFVGEVGFADFKREIEPPLGAPESGWVLSPWSFGKGYATEALRAALAWGDAHFVPKRTVCIVDPKNAVSIRVAEKCGYHEKLRTTYLQDPAILMERAPL